MLGSAGRGGRGRLPWEEASWTKSWRRWGSKLGKTWRENSGPEPGRASVWRNSRRASEAGAVIQGGGKRGGRAGQRRGQGPTHVALEARKEFWILLSMWWRALGSWGCYQMNQLTFCKNDPGWRGWQRRQAGTPSRRRYWNPDNRWWWLRLVFLSLSTGDIRGHIAVCSRGISCALQQI